MTTSEQHPSLLAAAHFVLKTRDRRNLTQTTLDGILQDTRGFIEQTVYNLQESIKMRLEGLNKLSPDEICDTLSPFSAPTITNPFEGLETQFKQEKNFQEHYNDVVN